VKIIIFGGAGFIGSFLVDYFLEKNSVDKIVVYDNFSSGKKWHLKKHLNNNKLIILEFDIHNIKSFIPDDKFNLAILLAANPDIARAASEPNIDFIEGTILTEAVLEFVRINHIPRLIYASGSGVYGDIGNVMLEEDYGPMLPISTYGASKLASEALICSYCHMFDLMASSFRFGNVVGGRQTHGVSYDFLRRLRLNHNELFILGDGNQSKPYVHISDIVQALDVVLRKQEKVYDVYNVSPVDTTTVNEIAHIVIEACDLKLSNVQLKYSGGDRGWRGDVPVVRLNTNKIRNLGWVPVFSSTHAVKQSVYEMIENILEIESGS
jgi:UDP-glucose 4-epimerase